MTRKKLVEHLEVGDFIQHPVWRFAGTNGPDIQVSPISRLPVKSLTGSIVGLQLTLANGSVPWCMLANVSVTRPRLNQQFLSLSVQREGRWFHLARYFDPDFEDRGPVQLAAFLNLRVDDIFPVRYDIRPYAVGIEAALVGEITAEPPVRLSLDERVSLSLEVVR